jgi:NADPH:quinone reductase-like Zn-dependent oxidoreductase
MLPHIDAASAPVVAVTAWQALFEEARVTSGQSVLVLGAAGNVGAFAIQFAHRAGLQVYATAHRRDLGYVRSLGADAFDGGTHWFEGNLPPIDFVIDLIGGEPQARSFSVLRRGGALISTVAPPDKSIAAERGVRAAFFLVDVTTERLARIAAMIEVGALTTSVGTILPLAAARVAHEMMESRQSRPRGKIVLRVAE